MAKKKKNPIDPLGGSPFILEGRVVTMNAAFKVLERGRVYLSDGVIRAVRDKDAAPPAGFDGAPIVNTGGTLFPGMIELHNHLSYNALQLWNVPRIFAHRGQWSDHPDKKRLISQPMSVLAGIGGTIEALVRYVEAKCLVSGVTSSQGLTLVAAPGIEHRYRGIVRNVENTDDEALPEALTRIADVDNATKFAKRLAAAKDASLILHLAEGIGPQARKHFQNLKLPNGKFAISPELIGIHSAGLLAEDWDIMAANGGSMVWSPLSNLLLYGGTADVKAAKAAGVQIALGSDWSPSGSKNLLSELKVARAFSERNDQIFTARELVAMATINPARMLKWDAALGSIEPGKRADFLVIKGKTGDPYDKLIKALEDDIQLVMINGVPRFGTAALMDSATAALLPAPLPTLESRKIAGKNMKFNFVQEAADPLVAPVSLKVATERLTSALRDLPELASAVADPVLASALLGVTGATSEHAPVHRWTLELENESHADNALHGETLRPLAPGELRNDATPFGADALAFNGSIAANLVSMELDKLTVAEDAKYFERLAFQINLPPGFAADVAKLHGASVPAGPGGTTLKLPPVADSAQQIEAALPRSLAELRALPDMLTPADRIQLVRQSRRVLEQIYVHLPLKRAAHAVDPLQQLRLLQYSLEEARGAETLTGLAFHQRLMEIFNDLRDLHTAYLLPPPYDDLTAFLPFMIERCFEPKTLRECYLVTKVNESLEHPTFKAGVELLYWNGMPIDGAIHQNANRQAGSNPAARFARGLAGMTIRPLVRVLPPEEEWVLMTYRALDGRTREIRLPWQISSSRGTSSFELPRTRRGVANIATQASIGLDVQMEAVNKVRRDLYATRGRRKAADAELRTGYPRVLGARVVDTPSGEVGYLRIYSFSVPDADAFVAEVVRLVKLMPRRGLILDVRNNGGGLIWAAEQLLQIFTDRRIEPERAQFLNSPRTLDLVRRHAPSPLSPGLDLAPWIESMSHSLVTGAVHSEGFPITPPDKANAIGRQYPGPVVLITDALAYSATDMFAAGFSDHDIGPILGVDENTGAGGANVWPYSLLQQLSAGSERELDPLPQGCDLRVAVRRTLRAQASAGMPLEDLGVEPDARHFLTPRDVLGKNEDLIAHAAKLLVKRRRR